MWTTVWTAISAIFNFLIIVISKKNDAKLASDKDHNELKEEMHQALLSGDNTAIVLCLNRYNELRKAKGIGS